LFTICEQSHTNVIFIDTVIIMEYPKNMEQIPPPISPEPTSTPIIDPQIDPIPPHKNRTLMYIAIGVGLIVVIGTVIGGTWAYTQGKKDIQAMVQSQSQQLDDLQKSYNDIRKVLDKVPSTPSLDSADLLDSSINSGLPSEYDDVLGVEEDLGIDQNRKLSEEYKAATKLLDNLKKNNRKIEGLSQSNPVISIFIPQNADLISDTDSFANTSSALLMYLQKVNSFEINSTMVGYQIGMAIQEAVVRSADDASVANLEKKIKEIDSLYEEYKSIDISSIPEDLQTNHSAELASFSEDVEIFNQILLAFQNKNAALLEKTLQSIIIQGQGASNESEVKFKSFWQDNVIINGVTDLSDRWSEYGASVGISE